MHLTLIARWRRCLSLAALLACCVAAELLWTPAVWAGANDAAGKKALAAAMDEYAKTKDAEKADGDLLEAISICGNDCSQSLLAQAWMYIGLVRGNGAKDWDSAREAFSVALGFDDKVQVDPRFFSPTAQALFDGIKGQRTTEDPAKVVPRFEAGTQMGCWPMFTEVETFRPVPMSCSTRVQGVTGVILRYRQYGDDNWTRVDFEKKGDEWRGQIPCDKLSRPGTWGMYIEAKDDRDNPLERLGSRDRPLVFKVVEKSEQPPPSLPGEKAPDRCVASTYCPEEMVGTPACDALQGGAAAPQKVTTCEQSSDCDLGMECQAGSCKAPGVCTRDADCGEDMMCSAGLCADRPGAGRYDWFGFHFGADLVSLSKATDACRTGGNEFSCYSGSSPYDGTPYPGNGGTVTGGLHLGTMRALISYDRFLADNISLGVRFGFAFGGTPGSLFPLHFEGRGTYYFGDVIRGRSHFVPYIALGVGVAQVDTRVAVQMVDCNKGSEDACKAAPQVNQALLNPTTGLAKLRTLDAYKSLGKVFATISPGLMLSFSKNVSGVANLGVLLMTEESRSTSLLLDFQPTLGVVLGF